MKKSTEYYNSASPVKKKKKAIRIVVILKLAFIPKALRTLPTIWYYLAFALIIIIINYYWG